MLYLDSSTDQELDRLSMEVQRLKLALEEEISMKVRLQDERKKFTTEYNKAKHEHEKEIVELKRQLHETKKGRMEAERLHLQSQAKQGQLLDELDLLKSRVNPDDKLSSTMNSITSPSSTINRSPSKR